MAIKYQWNDQTRRPEIHKFTTQNGQKIDSFNHNNNSHTNRTNTRTAQTVTHTRTTTQTLEHSFKMVFLIRKNGRIFIKWMHMFNTKRNMQAKELGKSIQGVKVVS